jgi:hypothetical protein
VFDVDGDGDDEWELAALHIQGREERRQHWQSADQSW